MSSPIEFEVGRIRELSKGRRHGEAVAAAEALAAADPQNRHVLYLIAPNQRCLNRMPEALATLQRLEQQHPPFSLLYQERGHCYVALRDVPRAIEAFRRGVILNPALAPSWNLLERLYRVTGEPENAAAAAQHLATLNRLPPEVVQAGNLFSDDELLAAENILRAYLLKDGNQVEAMRLLARIEHRRDLLNEAESRLEAALKLAPDYRAARLDYIRVLIDRQKYPTAREETNRLLKLEPGDKDYLLLAAAAQAALGEHESAIAFYRRLLDQSVLDQSLLGQSLLGQSLLEQSLLEQSVGSPELHVLLGHAHKAVGRQKEATECYQTAAAVRASFGDAYWSLANLKTYRFSEEEIGRMRAQEASAAADPAAPQADRYHLCFAIGKALEDRGEYAESWEFYARGNALKCAESVYHPAIVETNTRLQMEVLTAQFFAARAGVGVPEHDPIFYCRAAPLRINAHRADPRLPFAGRGHAGTRRRPADRARFGRATGRSRRFAFSRQSALSRRASRTCARRLPEAWRAVHDGHARLPEESESVLHR